MVQQNVAIFWYIAPCCPYVSHRFGGNLHLHFLFLKSGANSPDASWFIAGMILDTENGHVDTSVHIRTTRHYIPENGNINNQRCGKLEL
jgi:hypothetical protein